MAVNKRSLPLGDSLPCIAVIHGTTAAHALEIQHDIGDVCSPLWVVDSADPAIDAAPRLLHRFGPVVDIAHLSLKEAADALRPYSPDGILTFSDRQLVTTSHLAQELSVEFHTPEVAERMVDKVVQRTALRNGGLPVPAWWALAAHAKGDEVERVVREATFPVVLKPRRGTASSYTYFVENEESLRSILADPVNGTHDAAFIVEEFLPGTDREVGSAIADFVSVESAVSRGVIRHLAICGKFTLEAPFRGTGGFTPVDLPAAEVADILDVATRALHALGTTTGCTHTEIKLTPRGAMIVEVNGRIGGNTSAFIQGSAGVSLPHIAVDLALNQRIQEEGLLACSQITFRVHGQPPTWATHFIDVSGLQTASEIPGVNEVVLRQSFDTSVNWRVGAELLIYLVTGSANSHQEMLATRSRILATINAIFK